MSSRDLFFTRERLLRLQTVVAALLAHLEDVHSLAYEPAGRGLEPSRSSGPGGGVEGVGDARYRAVWTELREEVRRADRGLGDVNLKALSLLSEGPTTPAPSRGSTMTPEEFAARVAKAAGGHARLVEQPEYPGSAAPAGNGKKRRRK